MSGGSYDYAYEKINELAGRIQLKSNLRRAFSEHLYKVAEACKAIEWVDSFDASSPHDDDAIRKVLGDQADALALAEAVKEATKIRDELHAAIASAESARKQEKP
jgi:hypothetical protein